jgi:hypothetical protein
MTYTETGDWITSTVRNKPEALLLLAAGCALLLRGNQKRPVRPASAYTEILRGTSQTTQGVREATQTASGYASDLKQRASEAAGSYVQTATDYAEDARRRLSEQSRQVSRQAQSGFETVREQPLMVAALGLATGAALAALFPATRIEQRTMEGAAEAIKEAAGQMGENLMQAAAETTDQLKEAAAQRGLTPEGLKEVARDAANTFTSAAAGKSEEKHRGESPHGNRSEGLPLGDPRRGRQ